MSALASSPLACGSTSNGGHGGSAGAPGAQAGATSNGGSSGIGAGGSAVDSNGGGGTASAAAGAVPGGAGTTPRGGNGGIGGTGGTGAFTPVADYALASVSKGNCALDNAGAIQCWGYSPNPWAIPSGVFIELHACSDYVCAVRADHTVSCFDPPDPDSTESGIAGYVPKGKVQTLAVMRASICGTDDTGKAFCNSAYGGMNPPTAEELSQASPGFAFACGLRAADGTLTCWGYGGDEATTPGPDCRIPAAGQLTPPTGKFVALSISSYTSCALDKDGVASCWGAGKADDDPAAQCAGGLYNFGQATPPSSTFSSVSVSSNHACGVTTDGAVACWGAGTTNVDGCPDNECGQSQPPAGKFVQVSVGSWHSCAMTAERKVQCWGYPGAGAMGSGRLTPPPAFQ